MPLAAGQPRLPHLTRIALDCPVAPIQQLEVIEDGRVVRLALKGFLEFPTRGAEVAAQHVRIALIVQDLGRLAGQPDGQPRRCLDTSRAQRAFGFKARTPFRDGLIETIAWYEKHRQPSESARPEKERVR